MPPHNPNEVLLNNEQCFLKAASGIKNWVSKSWTIISTSLYLQTIMWTVIGLVVLAIIISLIMWHKKQKPVVDMVEKGTYFRYDYAFPEPMDEQMMDSLNNYIPAKTPTSRA
ncbi:hypothetical protein NEHOM01_1777 [Nematocida homosporus]|uniref:uncharacterized protein n=1 Tax=Nematocida homosporus TaxID=1912981 RepID=UPI00221EAB47|nr:uncharacterized protein NEHOM01_1777 [Nematocida homosporus]KAI5186888.1 hypothetical protein NEHOM01_1777 [Nematocida homosporus]